jgi:PAS domain S-box-containing protein
VAHGVPKAAEIVLGKGDAVTESNEMRTGLAEARGVLGHALKFQALAESMNQGAALLSADGTTLYANSRLGELVGRLPEKMAGTALVEALPPEQRPLFHSLIHESLVDDSEWMSSTGVFRLIGADGRETPCRLSCVPLAEEGAAVVMLTVQTVEGDVAHRFNNVFQVIVGYADVCLGIAEAGTPMRRYLQEIVTAVHRGAQMTRQLQSTTTD